MTEPSDLLKGLCPGSHEDLGAEFVLSGIRCETCNRTIHVDRRGVVRAHYRHCFNYLDSKGSGSELEFHGLESSCRSPRYFAFALSAPGAERWTAHMRFPLSELKLLHAFLGSVIANVEQESARDPAFREQLDSAHASPSGPTVVY